VRRLTLEPTTAADQKSRQPKGLAGFFGVSAILSEVPDRIDAIADQ
jgi:hypothetical protein